MAMTRKGLNALTAMQRDFVDAYMELGEQTKAAEIAGFKHPHKAGAVLMAKPHIVSEIDRRRKRIEQKILKPGEVITQAVNIMRGNIGDVMDWGFTEVEVEKPDGNIAVVWRPWLKVFPKTELPPEVLGAIAEISISEKGAIKIKMHDKVAAIERLMKHLGLYEKDNQQGTDALAELIASVQGTRVPVRCAASEIARNCEKT